MEKMLGVVFYSIPEIEFETHRKPGARAPRPSFPSSTCRMRWPQLVDAGVALRTWVGYQKWVCRSSGFGGATILGPPSRRHRQVVYGKDPGIWARGGGQN